MLQADIDEISFVCLTGFSGQWDEYETHAIDVCDKIDELLELRKFTINYKQTEQSFAGYNRCIDFDSFNILLCYHSDLPNMGIYLKFSGQGLKEYLKMRDERGDPISYIELVQRFVKIKNYFGGEARVSKVDFAIDFIDEGLNVSHIHKELQQSSIQSVVFDKKSSKLKLRKNNSKISTHTVNNEVQTIYVGSRKNKGNSLLLRIYDKKIEQLSKRGIYYLQAKSSTDWVRLEASFRQKYANQIGEDILQCNNNQELAGLIFRRMTDKYQFYHENGEVWDITKVMLAYTNNDFDLLQTKPTRKNDLVTTYYYLLKNSGLESFMFKLQNIYDGPVIDELFVAIKNHFTSEYRPSKDTITFLNKNRQKLLKEPKPWEQ
ncbi:TPA: replication initiation factor domain-containing protein [Streptococcus suis]|nr:replication initiation factor domain-containing protein [Streptococcus suis]